MNITLWASMRRELVGCNSCTHCHERAMAALRRIDALERVIACIDAEDLAHNELRASPNPTGYESDALRAAHWAAQSRTVDARIALDALEETP